MIFTLRNERIPRSTITLLPVFLLWTLPVLAQSGGGYDLSWNSIDCGGETFITGGGYTLGCTSGQADAGPLSGSGYELYAGFWTAAQDCTLVERVLLDTIGPGTSSCNGGDNYGLACMTCSGGSRHGEKCMGVGDCVGGGLCVVNNTLCPGSTCGGGSTLLAWPKSRYIGVRPNPTAAGVETAIRLTMVNVNGFPNCNGEVRWAGPPEQFCEGGVCSTMFWGSQLQSTPHWMDWTTVGVVQLYGEEIISDSRYAIQMIGKLCEASINNEASYSTPALMIDSAKWGDVVTPLYPYTLATQPTVADVLSIVDKWLGTLEPLKARSQLQPAILNPTLGVGIADVLRAVDAWLGSPYPFSVTTCRP